MLPVSLGCPWMCFVFQTVDIVSCVSNVASVSGLSMNVFCFSNSRYSVLCIQCCQCLWFVFSWFTSSVFCYRYLLPTHPLHEYYISNLINLEFIIYGISVFFKGVIWKTWICKRWHSSVSLHQWIIKPLQEIVHQRTGI